jgi:hypothetical protein
MLLGSAGCGGSGDGDGDGPASPDSSRALVEGTFAIGRAVKGPVELLAADNTLLQSESDAAGRYRFDATGLPAPFMLRGALPDGGRLHSALAAAPAAGAAAIANLTPLTELVLADRSPQGRTDQLWAMERAARSGRLEAAVLERSRQRVQAMTAPLASALGVAAMNDPLATNFAADGRGHDALLDALRVQSFSSGDATLFAVHALAAPDRPAVWTSQQDPPALDLGPKAARADIVAVQKAAEASYAALSQAAAGFDPARVDEARLQSVAAQLAQLDFFANDFETQVERLLPQLWAALGMPQALIDDFMRLLLAGADEAFDLLVNFFGEDAARVRADAAAMRVQPVSVDPAQGVVTYRVDFGGQTWFQDWTVSGNRPASQRLLARQHNECLKTRYVGPFAGFPISAESFIRDSEYFNECAYPVEFVSCVWRAGTTGRPFGCIGGTTTGQAAPGQSTGLRSVTAGPLFDERAFVVCAAPHKPVPATNRPLFDEVFRLAYQCALS